MISSFLKTDEGWSTLIDGKNPDSPQIWNVHKGEKVPCYLHLNTLKVGVEPSDNIRTATMNAAAFLESFFERLASEMGKKRVDAGSSFTAGPAQSKPSTESPDKAGSVVDKASAGSFPVAGPVGKSSSSEIPKGHNITHLPHHPNVECVEKRSCGKTTPVGGKMLSVLRDSDIFR